MKIRPLADRVLIQLDSKAEHKTEGGIVLPASSDPVHTKGTVVAVGPGTQDYVMTLKEGHRVFISTPSPYALIEIDGKKHVMTKEQDVIGVIVE